MSLHAPVTYIPENSAFRPIGFDDLDSAVLRSGYAYWRQQCGVRKFPAREDIRPRDIAASLRYISLVKVDGDDFIYRIVGDVIVMSFGIPLQNRRLSELVYDEPGFGIFVVPQMKKVMASGRPVAVRGKVGRDIAHVNFTDSENLLLPLGPDDDTVDHILTFSSYLSHPFG